MPVAIKIKRFTTLGDVPNTSELVDGEIAVNIADKKIYVRDGSSIVTISGADFSAVSEDIIPDGNGTRNLGSATKRFAELFLTGQTINLGGATIDSDGTGTVSVSATGVTLPRESKDEDGNKLLYKVQVQQVKQLEKYHFLQRLEVYQHLIKDLNLMLQLKVERHLATLATHLQSQMALMD